MSQEDLMLAGKRVEAMEKGLESIRDLSQAFKNPSLPDSSLIRSVNTYLRYGSIFPSFSRCTSTLDDLSSTGNLSVIGNAALPDSIVKHYAKHKLLAKRIEISTEWGLPLDTPFTIENNIMRFEPSTAFLFPAEDPELLAAALRQNQEAYLNNAAVHFWINQDGISYLKWLIGETKVLIETLEKELHQK